MRATDSGYDNRCPLYFIKKKASMYRKDVSDLKGVYKRKNGLLTSPVSFEPMHPLGTAVNDLLPLERASLILCTAVLRYLVV
jgi:hypothetical protein